MNDSFEKKARVAAIALWWVVLAGVGFVTFMWLVYLAVVQARPVWLIGMWGPNVELGIRRDRLVLCGGGSQDICLAAGLRGSLADAVGEAIA